MAEKYNSILFHLINHLLETKKVSSRSKKTFFTWNRNRLRAIILLFHTFFKYTFTLLKIKFKFLCTKSSFMEIQLIIQSKTYSKTKSIRFNMYWNYHYLVNSPTRRRGYSKSSQIPQNSSGICQIRTYSLSVSGQCV